MASQTRTHSELLTLFVFLLLHNRISHCSLRPPSLFNIPPRAKRHNHLRFFMRWLAAAKKTRTTFLAAASMTCTAFLATRLAVSSNLRMNLPRRVSHGMRPVLGFRSSSSLCLPMASATVMEGMLVLMVSFSPAVVLEAMGRAWVVLLGCERSRDRGCGRILVVLMAMERAWVVLPGSERSWLQASFGRWSGLEWNRSGGDRKSVVVLGVLQEAEPQAFVIVEVVSRKTQRQWLRGHVKRPCGVGGWIQTR